MREHGRRTRIVAVAVTVAALGAACGDDDGGGSAGSGSVEDWCRALTISDEGDRVFDSLTTAGADEVEAGLKRVGEIAEELRAASPPEIADDVNFLVEYIGQVDGALSDADYSIFDADLSGLDADRIDTVQANLDEFSNRECGRPFGSEDDSAADAGGDAPAGDEGDDGDEFDPAAGTIREQIIDQFVAIGLTQEEAECLANNVDPTDESVLTGDEAAILDLFTACNISLERLAELGG